MHMLIQQSVETAVGIIIAINAVLLLTCVITMSRTADHEKVV